PAKPFRSLQHNRSHVRTPVRTLSAGGRPLSTGLRFILRRRVRGLVGPREVSMSGRTLAVAVLVAFALAGCKRAIPVAPPSGPPEVSVAKPVVRDDIVDYDDFTGFTEAVERVEIRARVSGFLEAVHCRSELEVKEGDLLFEIDRRPIEADLAKARADV